MGVDNGSHEYEDLPQQCQWPNRIMIALLYYIIIFLLTCY